MKYCIEEIDLHITNRCINKCPHCNVNSPESMEEISGELICNFLEEAKELGASHLHITGGEPFFREDIFDILEKAKNLDMKVEIITSIELSINQMKRLKEIGIEYLTISIDGNEKYHDSLRSVGHFKTSVDNIKKALEVGLKVRVNTFIWKENVSQVNDLFRLTSELGVNKHVVFYFTPIGRGAGYKHLWLNLNEWKDFFNQTKEFVRNNMLNEQNSTEFILQKSFYEHLDEMKEDQTDCRLKNRNSCILLCDGSVYPCVLFMRSDKSIGNIKSNSIKDIWSNQDNWTYYLKPLNSDSKCINCNIIDICNGGCSGYSFVFEKDNTYGDLRCPNDDSVYPSCVWLTEKITV